MAFELKQYTVAIDLFLEEIENIDNPTQKARTAFLLGKSYEKTLDYAAAAEWYGQAKKWSYGTEATKLLALMLKQQEKYPESMQFWEELKSVPEYRADADREFLICKEAMRWKADPEPMVIEKCIESSSYSHYAPVMYRDQYLLVTSDRQEATGKSVYPWTGQKFSDLFLFSKTGNLLTPFDPVINTEHNEGTPVFTNNFLTMYFTRCQRDNNENDDCKIMVSYLEDGAWTDPETLPFTKPNVQFGHPALLENDSILVFTSDLESPGGNFDLYYTELFEDGSWADPEKMPSTINTNGNEKFPVADGDTLYFSSDYLPGMGGYDIFKTFLTKDRKWAAPVNMKYPVNSGGDDFSYVVDKTFKTNANKTGKGYFTSSRSQKGIDEIFVYTKLKKEKKPEKDSLPQPETSYFVSGKTFAEIFKDDNPDEDIMEKILLPDSRVQLFNTEGVLMAETRSSSSSVYLFEVEKNKKYILKANKQNYLTGAEEIFINEQKPKDGEYTVTRNLDLVLSKIYPDKEIILENIYYEYDKWDLTKEAFPTLEKLANMMVANPGIQIRLNSHTDCRGEDDYNMELSQKRAQSVVDFLISKGIKETRLTPVGYGETKLADLCVCESCTEAQHQKNRRTTFTIVAFGK
ncbi:MAG: OmpA family protein [Saprospiraceae bacterium]|nr:OmpA family protein [Saprospiraceae bacterium]